VSHAARFKDVTLEVLFSHRLFDGLENFESAGSSSAGCGSDENHRYLATPQFLPAAFRKALYRLKGMGDS
jgi:hypothetical protein